MGKRKPPETYDGYPSQGEGRANPSRGEPYIVTSQAQLPTRTSINFLEDMDGVAMVEKKLWIFRLCCNPKIYIKDKFGQKIGYSETPWKCCACDEKLHIKVPEDRMALKGLYECTCYRWCCPCIYECCNICNDVLIMDILDGHGMVLGSLVYKPRVCRFEPYCCNGELFIRGASGHRIMRIPQLPCPCQCNCLSCKECMCVCYVNTCCLGIWPCFKITASSCACLLWNDFSVPIQVVDPDDSSNVAHLTMVEASTFKSKLFCAPTRFYVDYERAGEPTDNKALLLATALIIEKYNMYYWSYNDANYTSPQYIAETVVTSQPTEPPADYEMDRF